MSAQQAGCFITVEGIEGVGKSTNIQFIQDWLTERGIYYVVTREPGGTELGEKLRELLLHGGQVNDDAEMLMMFASRAQHLNEKIKPALKKGQWVICDRFTDASFAYQGAGRGLDADFIASLKQYVHGDLDPHMTLLFDIDVATGMDRAGKRANFDRIEKEDFSFFERVRQGYLSQAQAQPERYKVVDAGQSIEQVQAQLDVYLAPLVNSAAVVDV